MRRRTVLALCGTATASLAGCVESSEGDSDRNATATGTPGKTPETEPLEGGDVAVSNGRNWPLYGNDVGNRGYEPDARGPRDDPVVAWRYDAGAPTMNSSPVVADGVVYGSGTGSSGLFALDAETGEEQWVADTTGYVSGAPAVGEETVYAGTWGQAVHAFDRASGEEQWAIDVGHRIGNAGLTLAGGLLYVATLGYGPLRVSGEEDEEKFEAPAVVALDPTDGTERWRYDDFGERDRIATTPAVAGGRVLFTCEEVVYALEATEGSVQWRRAVSSHGDLSPTVADGSVIVGDRSSGGTAVVALRLADGDEQWRTPTEASSFRVSPAVADGVVYAATSRQEGCPTAAGGEDDCDPESWGRLYALSLDDGTVRWTAPLRPDTRSAPAATADTVYVGNGDGVTAVAREAGDVRWEHAFETREDDLYVKSSPAVSGDLLVIGASDGVLRAIADSDL